MEGYNDGYAKTAPVGSFQANSWELYDMIGNVSEWTADLYDAEYYAQSPGHNPKGPSKGISRVTRGGSWFEETINIRSADRASFLAINGLNLIGFRCAKDAL